MPIYQSVTELIGRTPLLELCNYEKNHALSARLLAKLECMNPAGSAKDRVAARMIEKAEADGRLAPGGTVIEPTSGNTGIGLAAVAAARGYRVILTMPDTMSVERRALIAAYGAEIVLTPGAEGMAGSVAKAEELRRSIPGSIIAGQFENPANPEAHERTTGPEIWADTEGKVDIFVAGTGTGGTVTGVGRYLKARDPDVKIVAFEPAASPLLTEGRAGPHGLQGIGPTLCRRTWTAPSSTRSSPSRMPTPTPPAGSWPGPRASWWASPPAPPCGRRRSWRSGRRTGARPSWPCCRTAASGISPPPCSRTESGRKRPGDFGEKSPGFTVFHHSASRASRSVSVMAPSNRRVEWP